MRFYSAKAGHKVTVYQAGIAVQQVQGLSIPKRTQWGVLAFTPLALGSRTFNSPVTAGKVEREAGYLPMKAIASGRVTGVLTSEEGADQLRRAGHTITDDQGNDITERAVIEFLLNHKRYGVDFVSLDTEENQEMLADMGLSEIDSGRVFCEYCQTDFRTWGDARKHAAKNPEHREALALAQAKTYQIPPSESSGLVVT